MFSLLDIPSKKIRTRGCERDDKEDKKYEDDRDFTSEESAS